MVTEELRQYYILLMLDPFYDVLVNEDEINRSKWIQFSNNAIIKGFMYDKDAKVPKGYIHELNIEQKKYNPYAKKNIKKRSNLYFIPGNFTSQPIDYDVDNLKDFRNMIGSSVPNEIVNMIEKGEKLENIEKTKVYVNFLHNIRGKVLGNKIGLTENKFLSFREFR